MVAGSNPATPTFNYAQKKAPLLTKSQARFQANLLTKFLSSRRQGISPRTIEYYQSCIAPCVRHYNLTSEGINSFLSNLKCGNAKLNYYNAIAVFIRWLLRMGRLKDNPLEQVEKPKPSKRILTTITEQQVKSLLNKTGDLRDRVIISLLFDSGVRLQELANVNSDDINWDNQTILVIGKGNKQRRAPFTHNTAKLLRTYLASNHSNGNIWGINKWGIQTILKRLGHRTGIKCNPHSFRRGFACNLHRKGLSTLDIMHLGGWEDLSMVRKYTKSITFEDCLGHYWAILTMMNFFHHIGIIIFG